MGHFSFSDSNVVRSPSGRVIRSASILNRMRGKSEKELTKYVPGGKQTIVNPRYLIWYFVPKFWLNADINYQKIKFVKRQINKVRHSEFFIVITKQYVASELGIRLPDQVFENTWLNRKDDFRVMRYILTLLWLAIPIKKLLKNTWHEPQVLDQTSWFIKSKSCNSSLNALFTDALMLMQNAGSCSRLLECGEYIELEGIDGELLRVAPSNSTEYEFKTFKHSNAKVFLNTSAKEENFTTQVNVVLGCKDSNFTWLGLTDGTQKASIDLSILYALTDGLPLDVVMHLHQKYIFDAFYAMPFNLSVNVRSLIEVVTLLMVAQHYVKN